jgi:sugar O-acyltransferase (sialic acid O-acetyltransferase NeuD family)
MLLFGAGGHSKVVCSALEDLKIRVNGIFDDNEKLILSNNYKVICGYDSNFRTDEDLIISIGDNNVRKKISKFLEHKIGICVSKYSTCDKFITIGNGSVILQGAIVQRDTIIGEHVILNTASSIDHDCNLNDFVHISPGARLGGGVTIGEGTHIGINASVIPNLKIGKWCTIGAGAVIVNDIPDFSVVVGNPGRIIKKLLYDKA